MQLATVPAAAAASVRLIALALGGVAVGSLVLGALATRLDAQERPSLVASALASAARPAKVLLPFWGVAYASTVAAAFAQVLATKEAATFSRICCERSLCLLALLPADGLAALAL